MELDLSELLLVLVQPHLLWGDFKGHGPHVYFNIGVHTGDDEEHSRAPGSSCQQPAQSEDDGSLVLLDHLHHEEEGEGEGDHDEHEGANSHDESTDTRPLLAN